MYLEKINGPEDVKKLKIEELQPLADEVRKAVINRVSKIGGHKGPNLGIVEATIAMHYVFDSPKDEIVFDVSHQCYSGGAERGHRPPPGLQRGGHST